jgi:hypothetical protein
MITTLSLLASLVGRFALCAASSVRCVGTNATWVDQFVSATDWRPLDGRVSSRGCRTLSTLAPAVLCNDSTCKHCSLDDAIVVALDAPGGGVQCVLPSAPAAERVRECLAESTLMVFGDSTLRGIANVIVGWRGSLALTPSTWHFFWPFDASANALYWYWPPLHAVVSHRREDLVMLNSLSHFYDKVVAGGARLTEPLVWLLFGTTGSAERVIEFKQALAASPFRVYDNRLVVKGPSTAAERVGFESAQLRSAALQRESMRANGEFALVDTFGLASPLYSLAQRDLCGCHFYSQSGVNRTREDRGLVNTLCATAFVEAICNVLKP